jgi:Oxysterol-binding protein
VEDRRSGLKAAALTGRWDDSMYCRINDDVSTSNSCASAQQSTTLLWKKNKPPENPTRYNLTSFAITLNEIAPDLKVDISFHIPFCLFLPFPVLLGFSCAVHINE